MIKNTKRIFALVLAFAVVAMSMFTGVVASATSTGTIDLLEFGDYLLELGSTSTWYDNKLADNGETGTEADPIIIDSAEEFVYLAKASGDETAGKYYKVADGIKGFDLSKGDIDIDGTLADNIDKIKAGGKNHAGSTPGFQGNFDGNGVTVYGAWTNHKEGQVSNYAGLFSCTKGNVTIKNINVKFASFTAKNAAGGIVGYHAGDGTQTLTIENCSVIDSHLEVTQSGWGCGVGAIVGYSANLSSWKEADKGVDGNGDGDTADTIYVNGPTFIKNCYVNLDETYFISQNKPGVQTDTTLRGCYGGVAGVINSNALTVSDCVVIGIKPYATTSDTNNNDVQHSGLPQHFRNVYTDQPAGTEVVIGGKGAVATPKDFTGAVTQLSDAELKGAAAMESMKLDWSVWMADAEGYPELRSMHKDVSFVDNGNGTHGEVCACGFGGTTSEHIWVDGECGCGAILDCAGRKTVYWDEYGTESAITLGSGTKDDPYIISTVAEFAWLIKNSTAANTQGKYYKIADDIGTLVLQHPDFAEDILALETADDVQAFFENEDYFFTPWPNMGWEQTAFAGNFDGNGATVYGLYQVSPNNAGLFSTVDAGAVIENIAVKNSYITSTATNYQVAAIAPVSSSSGNGVKANGFVWIKNVVVANNYLYNATEQKDRAGVVVGAFSDVVTMDYVLVYGNKALDGAGRNMPLINTANNSVLADGSAVIPEGLDTYTGDAAIGTLYYNKIRNSIIMGTEPYDTTQTVGSRFNDPNCYENVYSDADASAFFTNITESQIKKVSVGELPTLDLDDAWLSTTTYPELAAFHDGGLEYTANNDGTHSATCSCETVFTAPCVFVDGSCTVCVSKMTCATKRTIYWNGVVATGFADTSAGTKDDPIIISSADELAYLISSKADVSQGKYFEIADDIGTIVLQPQEIAADIIALENAASVKAYFEDEDMFFIEWPEKGWEQSCFAGNFDGKGVKVYGLYQDVNTNAGLFSTIDAGAAIRNVAVLNSYMVSHASYDEAKDKWSNYQVGAIAAVTSNGNYGTGNAGLVLIDGCIVGNCFMRNEAADKARSGVIFGVASSDAVAIENCLVYGNDAKHNSANDDMAITGGGINSVKAPAVIPDGYEPKTQTDTNGDELYYNTVRNTIAFGTNLMNVIDNRGYRKNDPGCFENNYTDAAAGTVAMANGEWTYDETQIKAVTLETLNDNDLGSAWIKTESYPELKAAHIATIVDNGDGTHAVSCPCNAITGEAEAHTFNKNGVCSVCDAKCAHVAGEPVEENRKEPSCAGSGSYDTVVYCTVCGGEISRETTTLTGGHTPGEEIEENRIEATCNATGSYDIVVYCSECEEEISRETYTIEINPDAHKFDDDNDPDCNNGCGFTREEEIAYGDVDGNGKITGKDYSILMQYLNGWDVEIDEASADVDGNGKIQAKDYTLLIQYLNGWDVTLGPKA